MSETLLGAMTVVAVWRENGGTPGVAVDVDIQPPLQEMLVTLSEAEREELKVLRRDVARAATKFFAFLRDPDGANTPVD